MEELCCPHAGCMNVLDGKNMVTLRYPVSLSLHHTLQEFSILLKASQGQLGGYPVTHVIPVDIVRIYFSAFATYRLNRNQPSTIFRFAQKFDDGFPPNSRSIPSIKAPFKTRRATKNSCELLATRPGVVVFYRGNVQICTASGRFIKIIKQ